MRTECAIASARSELFATAYATDAPIMTVLLNYK